MSTAILKAVWGNKSGYVFIPRRNPKEFDAKGRPKWEDGKAYKYPEDWEKIKARVLGSAEDGWDTYWCPLVFAEPRRLKECVLPTANILWADLDPVDPTSLGSLKPSIAWKSSDDRYQALWFLDDEHEIAHVETVNKALTYKIGADKGGWDIGQVLRVPGSPNFKYEPPQQGKVLWAEKRTFELARVEIAVESVPTTPSEAKVSESLEALLTGWTIPPRTRDLLFADPREVEVGDRSDRLWEIETSLLEAGLPILIVVDIVTICPWNKFKGRKGEREQIHNEVLKADKHVKTKPDATVVEHKEPTPEEIERKDLTWAIPFETFTSKRIEKPEWLVEGIWQKGTYGMIAGEPKTYKSVQATDLALSVASGRDYLNYFPVCTSGSVLYIQEENNEQTVQDRVFKIAASKGLLQATPCGWQLPNDLPLYFSNNYGVDLTTKESRELIEQTIRNILPVLVILDPLYMMLGAVDENSAKEVGDVLRWLTYLRNTYQCAIMICHHYNKESSGTGAKRGGQRVRGSSAFHAWVESAIYVKATSELYTVKLEREYRAYPTMPEVTLKIGLGNPGDLTYVPQILDVPVVEDVATEIKIEEVCALLSMSPRTEEELESLCKVTRVQISRILRLLLDDNKIIKMPGGGRGRKATYILK